MKELPQIHGEGARGPGKECSAQHLWCFSPVNGGAQSWEKDPPGQLLGSSSCGQRGPPYFSPGLKGAISSHLGRCWFCKRFQAREQEETHTFHPSGLLEKLTLTPITAASLPARLDVGRPTSLQVILHTSSRVIFLKCNSDHVTFTLKILQHVPKFFRIEILTTLHGIQALSCFGFLTTSHSLSPYSAHNISSPSCDTMCDFPTPQLSLVSGSLSMLFPLPGMSFSSSRPLAPLSISSSPFKSQFQSQLLSDKVARLHTQTKCLPSCPIGPPLSPPKKSHGQSETLGFLSVFPTVCPY